MAPKGNRRSVRPAAGHSALWRAVSFAVFSYLGLLLCLFPLAGVLKPVLIRWTAGWTAALLQLLGAEGSAHGSIVSSSYRDLQVIYECTAVFPVAIFIAGVATFPRPWRARAMGLAMGVPVILIINLIRLASLVYVDHFLPGALEDVHHIIWPSVLLFLVVVVFLTWVRVTHELSAG